MSDLSHCPHPVCAARWRDGPTRYCRGHDPAATRSPARASGCAVQAPPSGPYTGQNRSALLREPADGPPTKIHDHAPPGAIGHERGPMIRDLRWRAVAVGRWAASCAKVVDYMLLWAIGKGRPKRPENPDPGNRRFRALAADPIFAGLPPGAIRTRWRKYPAKFPIVYFAGGDVWSEPCVILRFKSAQSVLGVHRFYAERAFETGWQTQPRDLPRTWSKHIAGRQASITLFDPSGSAYRHGDSYLVRASFPGAQPWKSFFLPAERGDDRIPADATCGAAPKPNLLTGN